MPASAPTEGPITGCPAATPTRGPSAPGISWRQGLPPLNRTPRQGGQRSVRHERAPGGGAGGARGCRPEAAKPRRGGKPGDGARGGSSAERAPKLPWPAADPYPETCHRRHAWVRGRRSESGPQRSWPDRLGTAALERGPNDHGLTGWERRRRSGSGRGPGPGHGGGANPLRRADQAGAGAAGSWERNRRPGGSSSRVRPRDPRDPIQIRGITNPLAEEPHRGRQQQAPDDRRIHQTATARPSPSWRMITRRSVTKTAKTATMIAAALVIVPAAEMPAHGRGRAHAAARASWMRVR
jgi:hypothetical protein